MIEYLYFGEIEIFKTNVILQNTNYGEKGDDENLQDSESMGVASTNNRKGVVIEESVEENLIENICDLLIIADQFMCEHLKEHCEVALSKLINSKNINMISNFAHSNRADLLLSSCEHFVKWGAS